MDYSHAFEQLKTGSNRYHAIQQNVRWFLGILANHVRQDDLRKAYDANRFAGQPDLAIFDGRNSDMYGWMVVITHAAGVYAAEYQFYRGKPMKGRSFFSVKMEPELVYSSTRHKDVPEEHASLMEDFFGAWLKTTDTLFQLLSDEKLGHRIRTAGGNGDRY